jgi:hypothetical protein
LATAYFAITFAIFFHHPSSFLRPVSLINVPSLDINLLCSLVNVVSITINKN